MQLMPCCLGMPSTVKYMLRAPPSVLGRVTQLDSLYLLVALYVRLLNLYGAPTRPLTVNGLLDPGCRFEVLVHLVSGKV